MIRNRYYFTKFIAFLAVLLASCKSEKILTYRISDSKLFENKYGVYYSLPLTILEFEVYVEKINKVKGPYSAYANKYLGLTPSITENSTTYNILDVKLNTYSEPDPDKIFFVEIPKNLRNKFRITLNEQGILQSVNFEDDSIIVLDKSRKLTRRVETKTGEVPVFNVFVNKNILEKADTLFEIIHLDTMRIEKQTVRRSLVEKTPEQRAKETSEYIIKLNENKFNLISGDQEVPYNEKTLEFMVKSIEKQINEYMSLFVGKTTVDTLVYRFTYIPDPTPKGLRSVIFNFDRRNGFNRNTSQTNSSNIFIELYPGTTTQKIALASKNQNKIAHKGIFYNIPEKTKLRLTNTNKDVLFETDVMISQLGVVNFLPIKRVKLLLNDKNGSIKVLEVDRKNK